MENSLTAFITAISAITSILLYWLIDTIKSKNLVNQIDRLKGDIKFTKHTDKLFSKTLISIYHGKVFQRNYGFAPLPSRTHLYVDHFTTCNVSVRTYKTFYKQQYLKYDAKKDEISLENPSTLQHVLNWMVFVIYFGCAALLMLLSKELPELINLNYLVVLLQTTALLAAVLFYYFAIQKLVVNILPYYVAKSVIKRIAEAKRNPTT